MWWFGLVLGVGAGVFNGFPLVVVSGNLLRVDERSKLMFAAGVFLAHALVDPLIFLTAYLLWHSLPALVGTACGLFVMLCVSTFAALRLGTAPVDDTMPATNLQLFTTVWGRVSRLTHSSREAGREPAAGDGRPVLLRRPVRRRYRRRTTVGPY